MRTLLPALCLSLMPLAALADDPPEVDFQPPPCTVRDKPISVCAFISDDAEIGIARVYFRPAGDKYFSYAEMTFGGINYCATLPAPRDKMKVLEYYVQAVDKAYQAKRTSTYQLNVQAEGVCGFPPLERDPEKAAAITVYAMDRKQGKKLPDEFVREGVTFVSKER